MNGGPARGDCATPRRVWSVSVARLALALLVCGAAWPIAPVGAAENQGQERAAPRGALTSGGTYYVTWTPDPDPVPLNEVFEIRFDVTKAADHRALVAGAVVTASAWMPKHNHGTTLQPQVESHGDGTAIGTGFLLEMQGQWELRVGVAVDGKMERATFAIELEP